MQPVKEQEPKLPTTPKEGAQIAIGSVCEELGQKVIAMDMASQLLLSSVPEDHPLRAQIKDLAGTAKRGVDILKKYRNAGVSGEFNFDVDNTGNPCLDIHPHSSTSLSREK